LGGTRMRDSENLRRVGTLHSILRVYDLPLDGSELHRCN
jgi:hypothetical protein